MAANSMTEVRDVALFPNYFGQTCYNMVEWFWWGSSLIFDDQLVFLQCFDTVGLVIWPVKIVPKMTYYVSSGTLNPTQHTHV